MIFGTFIYLMIYLIRFVYNVCLFSTLMHFFHFSKKVFHLTILVANGTVFIHDLSNLEIRVTRERTVFSFIKINLIN